MVKPVFWGGENEGYFEWKNGEKGSNGFLANFELTGRHGVYLLNDLK